MYTTNLVESGDALVVAKPIWFERTDTTWKRGTTVYAGIILDDLVFVSLPGQDNTVTAVHCSLLERAS
jgi:hypothetical protein